MRKVLLTATVQSHIAQFHKPLIKMLKDNEYEVHVAARNNLGEKNGLQLDEADKVFDMPFDRRPFSKNNINAYKQIKQVIDDNSYEIIHCNTPMGGVITRLAAKKARKKGSKIFYTAHGFHFYKGAPKKNWMIYYPIEKWLARHTDKLVTITEEDYDLAKRKFKTKVVRIHGVGADSNRFTPYSKDKIINLRSLLGYSGEQFLLICIGELNKNKNQSAIIKAVAKVKREIPEVKLLLAGNGPLEKELKVLTEKLNLTGNVEFLGYTTKLEKYINISDAVISSSYREGLPLNIMEAMLCGKPVIASNNRGHRELVKDNMTGFLLNPDNISNFSDVIIKLRNDSNLINRIQNNSIKYIEKYKINNVVLELQCIYELIKLEGIINEKTY